MILCENCSPRKGCTADKDRTECRFYQPMTEQEYLQTCNTEQLAEFLFDIGEYDWLENIADEYKKSLRMKQEVCEGIAEWLKQPHK